MRMLRESANRRNAVRLRDNSAIARVLCRLEACSTEQARMPVLQYLIPLVLVFEHEKYGGIVPEIASRNHLIYAPRLLDRAANVAKIGVWEVDAFAATSGPGLASSLMIGTSIAKGLAIGLGKPYLAINHLEGHLLSPFFGTEKNGGNEIKPNVSLVVSGGHTMLVLVRRLADYQLIGRTVDDAAGEAFDKVAKMLALGYPGGPEIENHAHGGDSKRFDLPRSMHASDPRSNAASPPRLRADAQLRAGRAHR